ncbi:hypothetical protein GW7_18973 [Heterocephalus glaber]|uniref:Uncharacterized protein n=1 Tax=Heterocephalus glaber TaxID=10181 RepID=G5BCK5_HETGA|nr:hypothetical protein GW7_18973 [Heterocephalus glaber]
MGDMSILPFFHSTSQAILVGGPWAWDDLPGDVSRAGAQAGDWQVHPSCQWLRLWGPQSDHCAAPGSFMVAAGHSWTLAGPDVTLGGLDTYGLPEPFQKGPRHG